jgi:hypothetical protein
MSVSRGRDLKSLRQLPTYARRKTGCSTTFMRVKRVENKLFALSERSQK